MASKKRDGRILLDESIGPVQVAPWTLEEASGRGGRMLMRGIFGEGDAVNGNRRKYPTELLERQVESLQEAIKTGQVTCLLDHPADGKSGLQGVAGKITKLWMDGNLVMGEAEVLGTLNGKELRALVEGGVRVGVSSRGQGSTKVVEDYEVVQEDYKLHTFDFVANPSVTKALPKTYVESQEEPLRDPVTLFQQEFPEAYGTLMEAASKDAVERAKELTTRALETAVETERTRVRNEMTEAFERRLRDALVGLREDLTAEIRAEFAADPAVGGAKAALAQICEMVSAYQQAPAPDALRDALRAREIDLAAAQTAQEEALTAQATAQRLLALEQRISGHPLAKHLREVLTPVVALGKVEDLEAAVSGLLTESQGMVPASQVEALAAECVRRTEVEARFVKEQEEVSRLQGKVEKMRQSLTQATAIGEQLDAQRQQAEQQAQAAQGQIADLREEVERLRVGIYARESLVGVPNARDVLPLVEGLTDRATVDKVIAGRRAQAMADGKLEAARAAIRGVAPGGEQFRALAEEAARKAAQPATAEKQALTQMFGISQ